jgi:hypothetical protein
MAILEWAATIVLLWWLIWVYGNPDGYEKELFTEFPIFKKIAPLLIVGLGVLLFKMILA